MKKIFLPFAIAFLGISVKAQFTINPDTNTTQLVNSFILSGVSASNVLYTGASNTLGSFTNGNLTNIGLNEGIFMTTGDITAVPSVGSPATDFASTDNSGFGDSLLDGLIPGYTTYNASILEFDLVPAGNVLEFQYVFASEEYPEYVGSSFNDVFGFFISGANPAGGNYIDSNIAIIPGSTLPVAINNVNNVTPSYPQYYVDNSSGSTMVYDGFTTVLFVHAYVVPSLTYHLKMAIADAGDGVFDSGIFLKAQSMKSYNETTGTEDHVSDEVSIFPNPAHDKISISMNGNSQIEIMNMAGQVLQSINADNSVAVDISTLPAGLYFARIKNADKVTIAKFKKE